MVKGMGYGKRAEGGLGGFGWGAWRGGGGGVNMKCKFETICIWSWLCFVC